MRDTIIDIERQIDETKEDIMFYIGLIKNRKERRINMTREVNIDLKGKGFGLWYEQFENIFVFAGYVPEEDN